MTMNQAKQGTSRMKLAIVFYYMFLLLGVIIIIRIGMIQIRDGKELREKARKRAIVEKVVESDRGNIYSLDGKILATSVPYFDIYVDFSEKTVRQNDFEKHYDSLAILLAKHFPTKTYQQYKKILLNYRQKQVRYGILLRKINYHQLKLVRQFPLFRLGRYRGGFIVEKRNERVYPLGLLAKRTIGYVKGQEKVGIEGAFNNYLAGVNGRQLKQRLPGGVYIPVNDNFIIKPSNGMDVITTIDTRIQDVAQFALLEHLKYHDADWGCAVLMEVKTGEIRAIANLERHKDNNYYEMFNHAVGTLYEPGSTFKIFPMMAMLEDNNLDLNEIVNTGDGKFQLGKWEVFDAHPLGRITAREVFEYSSNVGMILLVMNRYKNNPMKFVQRLIDISLNKPMGLDIMGEKAAVFPVPGNKNWTSISLFTMAYGYGVMITPLQLVAYYNAIVNDGVLVRPMFVREIRHHGKVVKSFRPVVLHKRICSPEVSRKLRSMMEGVVQRGTAQNLRQASCQIAGKTGTARVLDPELKKYSNTFYNASFVGYFPADNPKYSCIVVIHKPRKGFYYGSNVAGPVFRDIAEIVYATDYEMHDTNTKVDSAKYNVLASKNILHTKTVQALQNVYGNSMTGDIQQECQWYRLMVDSILYIQKYQIKDTSMVSVKGMKLREAVYLLESLGYKVRAAGYGSVVEQNMVVEQGEKIVELILRP